MMYSAFNTDCDSSSRCSTASPACDNLAYYNSPAGSYSTIGSPQSHSMVSSSVCSATPLTSIPSTASSILSTSVSIFSCSPLLSTASVSDVKMADLDTACLEESVSLLAKTEMETARSVPEVDLTSSLYAQDWEPLYSTANNDFESLCTPVVTCTTHTSSFTYPEAEAFPTCGVAHRRGSSGGND
ncbi:unnamed protein product, partial [Coregonus sp. 'balchen']